MCTDDRRPKEPRGGPLPFRIELTSSPDILDAKGRQVQLPTLRPAMKRAPKTAREPSARSTSPSCSRCATTRTQRSSNGPTPSAALRAASTEGFNGSAGKLAQDTLGKWSLTAKGRKALQDDPEQQVAKNIEK